MKRQQTGFLLIAAIILILIIGALGVGISHITRVNSETIVTDLTPTFQDNNIAEAGFNDALGDIYNPNYNDRVSCEDLPAHIGLVDYEDGQYDVSTTRYYASSPATLQAIDSNSLTLSNTSGYAPKGAVMINKEFITYSGISGNDLTGISRGALGSTQTTHAIGTVVSQNLCYVAATSYLPDKNNPTHSVTVSGYAPLTEAWAVGNKLSSDEATILYNGGSWDQFGPSANAENEHLTAAFANSYSDVWAVGDNGSFLHYDGSKWSDSAVITESNFENYPNDYDGNEAGSEDYIIVPDKEINGIHCLNQFNCWAVGIRDEIDKKKGRRNKDTKRSLIVQWDGAKWKRFWPSSQKYSNLYAVDCASENYCVAVGSSKTFLYFDNANNQWVDADVNSNVLNKKYYGISCPLDNLCFAVGSKSGSTESMAYLKNIGSVATPTYQWQRYSSNNVPGINLYDIDCPSSSVCYMVGQNTNNYASIFKLNINMSEENQPGEWTRFAQSQFISQYDQGSSSHRNLVKKDIYSIECASPSNCVAVGQNGFHAHFNGTNWYVDVPYSVSNTHLEGTTISAPPTVEVLFEEERSN